MPTTIRIDAEASGVEAGAKQAENAITNAFNKIQQVGDKSTKGVGTSLDFINRKFQSLGERLPFTALRTMNYLLIDQLNLSGKLGAGAGILTSAFMTLQGSLSSLAGPWGIVISMGTSLAGIIASNVLKTKEFKDVLKDLKTEWEGLIPRQDEYGSKAREFAKELLPDLEKNIKSAQKNLADFEATPQVKTWIEYAEVYSKLLDKLEKGIAQYDKYAKPLSDYNEAMKKIAEAEKKAREEAEKSLHIERGKYWEEQAKLLEAGIKRFEDRMKITEMELPPLNLEKFDKRFQDSMDANAKIMEDDIGMALSKIQMNMMVLATKMKPITDQISSAFRFTFEKITFDWETMLEKMISDFISSGISSLIENIATGGMGGGVFGLGGILGLFQGGTPYVPKTGAYILHQGEAVVSREQNIFSDYRTYSNASNIYVTIAAEIDKNAIKRKILPLLEELKSKGRLTI